MKNEDYLALLSQGVDVWNNWRTNNSENIIPDLIDADLSDANFSGTDLMGSDLSKSQVLGTNFTYATLTGACLSEWKINSATKLDNVDCHYVYLQSGKLQRHPSNGEFAPGEFMKLFQPDSDS